MNPDTETHADIDPIAMILSAIGDVAPDIAPELGDLDHDIDFWREFQLDSMDHLAIMTRLSAQLGRDIPEHDYPRLTTVNALRDYLTMPSH